MEFLRELIVIFALAVGVVVVFNHLRLPAIIGYLVAGALAGPHGFGLVQESEQVKVMAEIGVALLLFTIGMELSLSYLSRLKKLLFLGGGLQVGLTIVATAIVGLAFLFPIRQAIFLGMLVALSSTAIVLKLLAERGEMDSPQGETALAILIFQDLCVVPMTLLTPFLSGETLLFSEVAWVFGKALIVLALAVIAARYAVPWVLSQVVATRNREVFLLSIILLCVGTAYLTAETGLSLALGAFIAGLVISESEYSHQALGDILPFRHAFNGIFFVSIGMLFQSHTVFANPVFTILGVVALILGKAVIASGVVLLLGYPFRVAFLTGLGLGQIGEFSFVLATVGLASGIISDFQFQLFVGAAVLSMTATPFLWNWADPFTRGLTTRFHRWRNPFEKRLFTRVSTSKLRDHVIIVGFGVNGKNLARVMQRVEIPFIVVEMNPEIVRSEKKSGLPIIYGDAANREVLKKAGIARARLLVLAISDPTVTRHATDTARRFNPALHIIVRTRYVREMESLYALGANEVVPEEFETSIEIFSRVLKNFLVPRDVVESSIREIRQDGYDMFRTWRDAHRPVDAIREFVRGVEIEIYRVEEGSPLIGHSLAEADLRNKTGAMVLAIQTDSEMQPNPSSSFVFTVGSIVLMLGTPRQLVKTASLFKPKASESK
ncbi:MAG: hypothetical protein A3F68_06435 [Acidobacteria bacterium RIFCSPLOWO2_12_FULL_54_10]|nr:MAG: hypothetical protein A3F68_06435 [Acidobacteria bacterium RIFCSPLOWO2_12_FULL_54_10]